MPKSLMQIVTQTVEVYLKMFQRVSKFIRDYWCNTSAKTICESIYELKTKGLISQAEKISSQCNMESLKEWLLISHMQVYNFKKE